MRLRNNSIRNLFHAQRTSGESKRIGLWNLVTTRCCFRSSGVLAYVLLSGLSPFLDETVEETRRNMLSMSYTFPIDRFASVSTSARQLIERLLLLEPG